ncbi:MAG: DNA repair protein RadC [Prevotella sp.]|nr:DNA repair protein RadC [Prevotella sp.]
MEKLNINQWALEDRPREKFMAHGAEALSKAELLAILIGSGTPKESAVSLMQRILNDCEDNLNTLGKMSLEELMSYHGIGEAKAITILAACELGKRRQLEDVQKRESISCAADIYTYLHSKMQDCDTEQAWIMLLNQNFKLIKAIRISSGGITETAVDVRQIIKHAVINNATVLALSHNHPSNNPNPSKDDDNITQRVKKACELMRIHFLDHVIVTDGAYYSYQEHGRI